MLVIGKWAAAAALGYGIARVMGGWAVVTVENPPEVLREGATYRLEFTVRQHGVTLLDGLSPYVVIRDVTAGLPPGRGTRVAAQPAGATGRYAASFTVPAAGRVGLTVESGFGRGRQAELTLLPIRVARAGTPVAAAAPVERGRALFVAKGCVSCHAHGGLTAPGNDNARLNLGPDLTDRPLAPDYVRQRIRAPSTLPAIGDGPVRMPDLGLRPEEIEPLVALLASPPSSATN